MLKHRARPQLPPLNDNLLPLYPTTLDVLLAFCRPLDRRSAHPTTQTEIEKTPSPPTQID
jgi:hypothetical protein